MYVVLSFFYVNVCCEPFVLQLLFLEHMQCKKQGIIKNIFVLCDSSHYIRFIQTAHRQRTSGTHLYGILWFFKH
jgi:hypothetical protein